MARSRQRAFSLGIAGLFTVPLAAILPAASTYWGVGARRRLADGRTGAVVSCRTPSIWDRARSVADGWHDVRVILDDTAVARFTPFVRRSPQWFALGPGPVRVRVEGGAPLPLPRLEFDLTDHQVVLVEVVPAMRTGPRWIRAPHVTVYDADGCELARWTGHAQRSAAW